MKKKKLRRSGRDNTLRKAQLCKRYLRIHDVNNKPRDRKGKRDIDDLRKQMPGSKQWFEKPSANALETITTILIKWSFCFPIVHSAHLTQGERQWVAWYPSCVCVPLLKKTQQIPLNIAVHNVLSRYRCCSCCYYVLCMFSCCFYSFQRCHLFG